MIVENVIVIEDVDLASLIALVDSMKSSGHCTVQGPGVISFDSGGISGTACLDPKGGDLTITIQSHMWWMTMCVVETIFEDALKKGRQLSLGTSGGKGEPKNEELENDTRGAGGIDGDVGLIRNDEQS